MRAVTFDCWGTLLSDSNFAHATQVRIDALVDLAGGRLDRPGAEDVLRRGWAVHHGKWINGEQYGAEGVARFVGDELGLDDQVVADLQHAMEEAGRQGEISALPGAVDTLRALREAGIRTALVCDAGMTPGRVVRDFLDQVDLLPHLEHTTFSNELGVPKPNPAMFHDALDALDTAPRDATHIGDLLRTDIFGGRSVGMMTVRITAVNDDASDGFSWDPNPSGLGEQAGLKANGAVDGAPFEEADAVISSYDELFDVLRGFGAAL